MHPSISKHDASSKLAIAALTACFFIQTVLSAPAFGQGGIAPTKNILPNEFTYSEVANELLIPVYVWGNVKSPGLYNVPKSIDFKRLLSLAGGPQKDTDLENLKLIRTFNNEQKTYSLDLENFMDSPKKTFPEFRPDDALWVPANEALIERDTLSVITAISSIVGIIVSIIVIDNQLSSNSKSK